MKKLKLVRRVIVDTMSGFGEDNGLILAGHLAYLTLLGMFPFFIFIVWLAGKIGRSASGIAAIETFLNTVPPNVAAALQAPVAQVTQHRPQELLTIGVCVAIWTAGSVVETLRIIIHKAYNQPAGQAFWRRRLHSVVVVICAALLLLIAMGLQFSLSGLDKLLLYYVPGLETTFIALGVLRKLLTPCLLFGVLVGLHRTLTPGWFGVRLHWPGALLTTVAWIGIAAALPYVLVHVGGYSLTYGSLAGVMVTLLFFYLIGSAFVVGAQLNGAILRASLDNMGGMGVDQPAV